MADICAMQGDKLAAGGPDAAGELQAKLVAHLRACPYAIVHIQAVNKVHADAMPVLLVALSEQVPLELQNSALLSARCHMHIDLLAFVRVSHGPGVCRATFIGTESKSRPTRPSTSAALSFHLRCLKRWVLSQLKTSLTASSFCSGTHVPDMRQLVLAWVQTDEVHFAAAVKKDLVFQLEMTGTPQQMLVPEAFRRCRTPLKRLHAVPHTETFLSVATGFRCSVGMQAVGLCGTNTEELLILIGMSAPLLRDSSESFAGAREHIKSGILCTVRIRQILHREEHARVQLCLITTAALQTNELALVFVDIVHLCMEASGLCRPRSDRHNIVCDADSLNCS